MDKGVKYTLIGAAILLILVVVYLVMKHKKKSAPAPAPVVIGPGGEQKPSLVPFTPLGPVIPAAPKEGFAFDFDFDQSQQVERYLMAPPNLPSLPVSPRSGLPGLAANAMLGDVAASPYVLPSQPVHTSAALPQVGAIAGGAHEGFAPVSFDAMGATTSEVASNLLGEKMNGATPKYFDPMLPLADIVNTSTDPTQPENFMYTRTVFAPLKRQYGNGVDFIRGDVPITYQAHGWFDVRPPTDKDIVTGYFDKYIDIQQQTALKDYQFSLTTPAQNVYQAAISPAGHSATREVMANV